MAIATYKGFSSKAYLVRRTFGLTDVDLVKQDLINHIFTKKGERRGMPGYGTIIPDAVFEMLDEFLLDAVYTDLERVFKEDPRVEIINLDVNGDPDNNSLLATADLRYIELDTIDELQFFIPVGQVG